MSLENFFQDKDVLVTGGCGSIGSEIVRQLIKYPVKKVRVLDNNETGLFDLDQELGSEKLRCLLGDIRDKERIKRAMRRVNIVFHCAALKHVPLCEYNPFEAVATNVYGTQNLIDIAQEEEVEKFVGISTDKVVSPINTMGATKLLSEKLILNTRLGEGEEKILFSCVRFGNVLNSCGSVIPVFREQIKKGGPITITSKEMVRFFMSISDAVNLVLEAGRIMEGREIFILKMRAMRIIDLAEVMIEELAPKFGYSPAEIEIKIIGERAGERLHEALMTAKEAQHAEEIDGMFVFKPRILTPHYIEESPLGHGVSIEEYHSKHTKLLSKNEIKQVLNNVLH